MPIGNEPIPGAKASPDNPITLQNPDSVVQSSPASTTMNPEAPRPTVGMNQEAAPVVPAQLLENVPAEKRPLIKKIIDRLGATKDAILNTSGNALRKLGSYGKDNWQDYAGLIGGAVAGSNLVTSGVGAVGVAGATAGTLLFRNFIEPKFHSRALGKAEEKYTGQQLVEKVEKIKGKHDKIQRFTANAAVAVVIGGVLRGTGADKAIASFLGDRASDLGSAGDALFGSEGTVATGHTYEVPGLVDKALGTAGNLKDNALSGLGNLKDTAGNNLGPAAQNAADTLGGLKDSALEKAGEAKDAAGNALFGSEGTVATGHTYEVPGLVDKASDALGATVRVIGDNVTGPLANKALDALGNAAGTVARGGTDAVGQAIHDNAGALAVGATAGAAVAAPIAAKIKEEQYQNQIAESLGISRPGLIGRFFGRITRKKNQQ